ncbi:24-hydroxycholesterol 7-alpha-hydroxylase-like [Branchiostoma floridae x Branchiostoma japonicum]
MATTIGEHSPGDELYNAFKYMILFSLCFAFFSWRNIVKKGRPPCMDGWIPWFGCAIDFGKAPLDFIEETKRKLGPVFTIVAAGRWMTFVTEPEDITTFFQSPNLDFQKAVQDPVSHTASVSTESFFQHHTKIHDTIKGRLAPANLHSFCSNLWGEFKQQLEQLEHHGKDDLNTLVRRCMFAAVVNNLFGAENVPTDKDRIQEFSDIFVKYDADFEYGSQLPPFFLREWAESKKWLLSLFSRSIANMERKETESQTLLQSLTKMVDRPHAPNYALLMLWASQANAVPMSFWVLAMILSNEDVHAAVKKEVQDNLGSPGDEPITEEDLKKLPLLKRCIMETIRLRSPGVITRAVDKPLRIRKYIVPKGHLLMMSPYWAHRNPNFFPEPDKFLPERWLEADLEKNLFLDGFVGFGGGRYQCPGRWFALMEMQMLLAMMIQMFDFKLLGEVPKESPLHVVGTQQPVGPCPVEWTKI